MNLSIRLQTLAEWIKPGLRLADVGTDHGYVPIYLVEKGLIPYAIALDINEGPLSKADAHIREHGLNKHIETRLSDGLKELKRGEADTILIAGMGGPLMKKILIEGQHALDDVQELILQPQSEIEAFRRFIHDFGYRIIDEQMVEDDHKFYTMMKVEKGFERYDLDMDYLYGKKLIDKKDPVLKAFLIKNIASCEAIHDHLETVDSEKTRERLISLTEEIRLQKEVLDLL